MNENTLPRGPRRLTEEEIEALRVDMKESSDLMREQFAARRKLKEGSASGAVQVSPKSDPEPNP